MTNQEFQKKVKVWTENNCPPVKWELKEITVPENAVEISVKFIFKLSAGTKILKKCNACLTCTVPNIEEQIMYAVRSMNDNCIDKLNELLNGKC